MVSVGRISDRQATKVMENLLLLSSSFRLAGIPGAGGLNEDRRFSQKGATQPGRDRLPQGLMCVNQVVLGPESDQSTNRSGDIAETEQRAGGEGANPTMNLDAAINFIAGKVGHIPRDHE